MSDEPVGIDAGAVRALGGTLGDASRRADELAALVTATSTSAAMDVTVAGLLGEIADELGTLGTLLRTTADLAEHGDTWGGVRHQDVTAQLGALWRTLQVSLDDDVGVGTFEAAPFTLAESIHPMSYDRWMGLAVLRRDSIVPGGGRYVGGGSVTGPDGRQYPIVIPLAGDSGDHSTADLRPPSGASATTLFGTDAGWVYLGARAGVERFTREPAVWQRVLAGAAGSTGLVASNPYPNDALTGVVMAPYQAPTYVDGPAVVLSGPNSVPPPIDATARPLYPVVVDGMVIQLSAEQMNRVQRRAVLGSGAPASATAFNTSVSAVDAAITLGQAAVTVGELDNQSARAYQVVFEEHDDGRRRARIETYQLLPGEGDEPVIEARHIFVGEDGRLMQSAVAYHVEDGTFADVVRPDFVIADPEHAYVVPDAAFPDD